MLEEEGIATRVVSLPSWYLFGCQDEAYRRSVLPSEAPVRVAVEAGVPFGWERWVGDGGAVVGIDRFGASAPYEVLYKELGLTPTRVAAVARQLVAARRAPATPA
jgi:transketolase